MALNQRILSTARSVLGAGKTKHNANNVIPKVTQALGVGRMRDNVKVADEIIMGALGHLIMISPVDQGHYRASHTVTMGRPTSDVAIVPDRSMKADSPAVTLAKGRQALKLKPIPRSQLVFITNPLIYANALEHGHSDQAPPPLGIYKRVQIIAERKWRRMMRK